MSDKPMTVKQLIAALKKMPERSRVDWVDALGNHGTVHGVSVSNDGDCVVDLDVIEAEESYLNHMV